MSGNLFPVKLLHLVTEMKDSGVFDKLAQGAKCLSVQTPDDGLTRLVLCSPEVQQATAALTGSRQIRVRLALPADLDFLQLAQRAQFEVYSGEGISLQSPIKLVELDDGLANAVQVELFHEILRAKGSSIPLL